jgi:hypothetical protein
MSEQEHERLIAAASREGRSLSDYLRRCGSIIAIAGEDAYPRAVKMLNEPARPERETKS